MSRWLFWLAASVFATAWPAVGQEPWSGHGPSHCCRRCGQPSGRDEVCVTCQRVPEIKKIPKTEYRCKREHYCLPERPLCEWFAPRSCCLACGACGNCECPPPTCPPRRGPSYPKMVPMKRVQNVECPGYKLEPLYCSKPCADGP